jgi:uncharacterized membrane protein
MKLFKVLLIIAAIVIAFVGISRFFSPSYFVKETIVVNKPIHETFSYLNNVKNWEEWSLWNKSVDSTLYFFYTGKTDSVGAKQYFAGNLIGSGSIKITNNSEDTLIWYHMNLRGGDMIANGRFEFKSVNSTQTEIAWIDSGNVGNNPIKRYMIPMVTKNTTQTFQQGLSRIKERIEFNK